MKKILFTFTLLFTLNTVLKAQSDSIWIYDGAHSSVVFSITHLMISDLTGSIKINDATIVTREADFTNASVTLSADVKTIDTDNEMRDEHLMGEDFFEAAKFPVITFKSVSFDKIKDNTYKITGDLTMHGISKTISLDAIARKGINPYDKSEVVAFKVTGTILRTDFNISPESSTNAISNEVSLVANMEFTKK